MVIGFKMCQLKNKVTERKQGDGSLFDVCSIIK